ncbi:MAG TPA: hypothetical protein VK473_02670 [Terriglobales bacterium]|nr:hypothetical protein [Terriglobales bacterium]
MPIGRPGANLSAAPAKTGGPVDHWSAILFYSMGFGALAVAALFLVVLAAVWLYGQFVWTFTHWDFADFRLAPFKRLAYLIVGGTFAAGTCAGLWCFSGAAWRNRKTPRANSASARRGSR